MITHEIRQLAALAEHPGWPILLEKLAGLELDALGELERPASRDVESGLLAKWRGIREARAAIRDIALEAQNTLASVS